MLNSSLLSAVQDAEHSETHPTAEPAQPLGSQAPGRGGLREGPGDLPGDGGKSQPHLRPQGKIDLAAMRGRNVLVPSQEMYCWRSTELSVA